MSSHIYEPTAASDHPVFHRARYMGFIVATELVPFLMVRDSAQPNDWQGGRKLVSDPIWGSGRVLEQDGGAAPLTLTTGLVFRDREAFQRFWALQTESGTLRMNAAWTMHAPDRTWHQHGVDYAEFDDVSIVSPGTLTFDLAKRPMLSGVTFQREDPTWD